MAVVFRSEKYSEITIDSHQIVGITGYLYQDFIQALEKKKIYYIDNVFSLSNEKVIESIKKLTVNYSEELLDAYLNDLGLDKDFLSRKINTLSHSEQKLWKYLKSFIVNKDILVIDEPLMDLDYDNTKRIIAILNRLAKYKTIIVASMNTDIIYTLCKKVLLLANNSYLYDDVKVLANKNILKKYNLSMPQIIEFIRLANDKKAHLPYSKDIRDLIKDVYKSVTK